MSHASFNPLGGLESLGINTNVIIVTLGLVMMYFAYVLFDLKSNTVISYTVGTAPIWLPITTFLLFFEQWLHYVQKEYKLGFGRTTLEIRIPQDVFKSPQAMELILTQMYQTASPDNYKETYIDGKHPPTFALELVSRGGDVKFYINVPKKRFKDLIEAQFYAHYPGIELHELDIDYTAEVVWDKSKFTIFSFHFGLKKADAYPIKTYIDYGMDSLPKEEEKIDPINTVLDMLASINPKEHLWIQILISANRKAGFKEGSLFAHDDWKEAAKAEIESIIAKAVKRNGTDMPSNPMMALTDNDTVKAIERSLGKYAFDTAIRGMYIGPADAPRIGDVVPRMLTAWRAFDDINRNSIGAKWRTDFDYPWWQDPKGTRRDGMKKQELNDYKRRYYEARAANSGDHTTVFTVEELATIFHIPGRVATTPSLARIPSKRAEPPPNLPIA